MSEAGVILRFSCPDRPGIVVKVATFFRDHGYNIRESDQFEDIGSGQFFMRTRFTGQDDAATSLAHLKREFDAVAQEFSMDWKLVDADRRMRTIIAVSKGGHCLNHILHQCQAGRLPIEIAAVLSNHQTQRDLAVRHAIPFIHLPVKPENRAEQEAQILAQMEAKDAELLVLARYMQILSDETCRKLDGKAINIHHSFLPSFVGAQPYHQAFDKGVKLIGATAHYVTPNLDQGPIIEQDVTRVSHANGPDELAAIGSDIESLVLTRAIRWHAQHRVLINGRKTIVFTK